MLKKLLIIAVICTTSMSASAWADTPEGIHADQLQVMEDASGKLSIDQVINSHNNFRNIYEKTPNYLYSSSAYWFRIPIRNVQPKSRNLYLDIPYPTLDYVTLYVVRTNGNRDIVKSGDRTAAKDRPVSDAATLIFPFTLHADESAELYIRIQGEAQSLQFAFQIQDESSLQKSLLTERLIHGIMLGAFALLFIYNLFLYLILREKFRIFYLGYLPFAFLGFTALDGFGPTVLYPSFTWLNNEGMTLFHGISCICILLFTRVFLQKDQGYYFDRSVKILIGVSILLSLSPFILPVRIAYQFAVIMLAVLPFMLMIFGFVAWQRGKTEVRFYVLAQSITWLGLFTFALVVAGVLPFHKILLESVPIGICGGALLHSLAIADRIRILQRKNLASEEVAHRNLELRQEELEHLITQRTNELEAARVLAELQATTDLLTGIYNRRGLFSAAERELRITIRYGRPLSLVIFDLDQFKLVNDTYGHAEGDKVLREVALTAGGEIRSTDLFGRIGGEEFLIVMPDTTDKDAYELAERLRVCLSEKVFAGPQLEPVTASFGVAWLTENKIDLNALIKAADNALYRAKQNGRNRTEKD